MSDVCDQPATTLEPIITIPHTSDDYDDIVFTPYYGTTSYNSMKIIACSGGKISYVKDGETVVEGGDPSTGTSAFVPLGTQVTVSKVDFIPGTHYWTVYDNSDSSFNGTPMFFADITPNNAEGVDDALEELGDDW